MPLVGKSASPYITEIIYNTKKKGMVYEMYLLLIGKMTVKNKKKK